MGVTLDLTGDFEFWFQNATLTVNGTVNASGSGDQGNGWVNRGLCIGDGTTVINGNGTINLMGKGQLLNIWGGNGRKLTLDGVTLIGVPDNNESLVTVSEGGELVIVSGAITGNTRTRESGGGVHVNNATFIMSGGEISGNSANRFGGGVDVRYGAIFTLEGGTIYGSEAGGGNANTASIAGAALVNGWDDPMPISPTAKWGTGGTYTKGGVPQTGGSDIVQARRNQDYINDTLIAIPAR